MDWRRRVAQAREAMGSWTELARKKRDAARVVVHTFRWNRRRRRLQRLRAAGHIDVIPTEWQIAQASYEMLTEFLIPSNAEFYAHYDADEAWTIFLRFLDEPATMLDPTGLTISRDLLVAHLLHTVHVSAGYDVALLEIISGGLDELQDQCRQVMAGTHPRQEAIVAMLEREDYPERLLAAVDRYRRDPRRHWEVRTYDVPEDCAPLLRRGLDRFGTLGRLMRHAATLPRTPWHSLGWVAD